MSLGNANLTPFENHSLEVERLHAGRYRFTRRFVGFSVDDISDPDYKTEVFDDLGTPDGEVSGSITSPVDPEATYRYADARLVRQQVMYPPNTGFPVLEKVYETLTGTFVEEVPDRPVVPEDGLREVRRQLIAKAGTDASAYYNGVGTLELEHQFDSEGSITLFLARVETEEHEAYRRLVLTYKEAGTVSTSTEEIGDGLFRKTSRYFKTEIAATGPILSRSQDNVSGIPTITVSEMVDKDGNSIVNADPYLADTYEREVQFTYPGEVFIDNENQVGIFVNGNSIVVTDYFYNTKPPITRDIESTFYVFYQTEPNILPADYTYDGAIGRWNPQSWASGSIKAIGTNLSVTTLNPIARSQVFNQYTTVSGTTQSASGVANGGNTLIGIEGNAVVGIYNISVTGGPGRPDGKKYVLNVDNRPAFQDNSGNQYYRKVIVVATIPTRT